MESEESRPELYIVPPQDDVKAHPFVKISEEARLDDLRDLDIMETMRGIPSVSHVLWEIAKTEKGRLRQRLIQQQTEVLLFTVESE